LKRAIFKIAAKFHIESRTTEGGFEAAMDVEKWAEKDQSMEDWKIPITYIKGAKSDKQAGTDITFRESPVYQSAKLEMNLLAKPIISFLNDMYPSDLREEPEERKIAERVRAADLRVVASKREAVFEVKKRSQVTLPGIRVQFDATGNELNRVRKCIGQPRLSANKIGRYTFDQFLKTECPE
jgi:hypothetical protein